MGTHRRSEFDRFLGHRLKELRLRGGMTQQQVAQELGISHQQVHKVEKGADRVSAGQLVVIARLFDLPVGDLFNGYDCSAPLDPLGDPKTSRMLLNVKRSFLELEPKYQDALVRLARALATEG